tara:strand:+ start:10562 stop:11119 length:558 start_codon:yes stop_codon:yes gene_type:complete
MKYFFVLVFINLFLHSCIPVKNVSEIDGYEIIVGKPKSNKERKRFTKFKVSNQGNYPIMVKFLNSKFDDVFEFGGKVYVRSKIANISKIDQELIFYFSKDQEKYLSPLKGLQRKDLPKYDRGYGAEGESILLNGKAYFFMEVVVKDELKLDYLSTKSIRRNEVIVYLQNLMVEYTNFQKNYMQIQ